MDPDAIAAAVWEYVTRTLASGTPDPPTNRAEEIAQAVWEYAERTLSIPANIEPPSIGGLPPPYFPGMSLICSTGTWTNDPDPELYTYQWLRDDNPIGGATDSSYLLVGADVGAMISCEVTATNDYGPSLPAQSNEVGPIVGGSGTRRMGLLGCS